MKIFTRKKSPTSVRTKLVHLRRTVMNIKSEWKSGTSAKITFCTVLKDGICYVTFMHAVATTLVALCLFNCYQMKTNVARLRTP